MSSPTWRSSAEGCLSEALLGALACCFLYTAGLAADADPLATTRPVSFHREIRPLLQVHCQGCHQPAKPKGGYVLTDFDQLVKAGESGKAPLQAGQPAESYLVAQITPTNGVAEMPKGKPPLRESEIALVRRWIEEGATNDTPPGVIVTYDTQHPPLYSRPPVITSLDYSPDGRWIAVAGFHEVLLHRADGSGLEARLIGLSERIQTVRFSPDGSRLAVAGGQPCRVGEIQIWDVEGRKLLVSSPVGYDTVYGVSWSPDGQWVAFGLPDKTVRALDAATGKQVLQQGSHEDWVLDTVFSTNGSHIVSVSRDMSAKLTEVANQRFVDNITSITPGALRGGLQSVARHPQRDEVLVGGANGEPRIFQIFRQATRRIGDDATLLHKFPAMEGRIFSVDYSPDGDVIAAAAALDGRSAINLYAAKFDPVIPANILKAYEKTSGEYSPEERAAIERFTTNGVRVIASVPFPNAAIYALSFSADGQRLAAAGSDGQVHLIETASGRLAASFAAAPVTPTDGPSVPGHAPLATLRSGAGTSANSPQLAPTEAEQRLQNAKIAALTIEPSSIALSNRNDHVQILVTARLNDGSLVDATRVATIQVSGGLGEVSSRGQFTGHKTGQGTLSARLAGQEASIPVSLSNGDGPFAADFIHDVTPVIAKLGCSAGTCHGAREGKNGYKLSLRGYDPVFDVRSLTDDLASRRANLAAPDQSLLLLKATAAVPHEGGQRMTRDSEYYAILRQWIADGAGLNPASPRVARLQVFPENPVIQTIGLGQQLRVVATYADGRTRDVTAEAFMESGNTDVAVADTAGLMTSLRRGEAPILARFEGNYAATTLTVMGDRTGFVWKEPAKHNRIDELVAAKWERMKILPSDLCSDAEFIRRVSLDLVGLPPSPDEVRAFLADSRDTRVKRDAWIEKLLGSPAFVDHWASKWADLLLVNRKFLGEEGARLFRDWIRKEIEANTPYDEFARKIVTATGSNKENPPASYWKVLREAPESMENTTHLFLATRFNCNKCHDHPFERWTQDQYFHLTQYFAQVEFKKDDASGDRTIGGTAVEGAKPLFETVGDRTTGEVPHLRTGKVVEPEFPFEAKFENARTYASRREVLAAWITSPDNRYFALSRVNRLWGYLMGVGLIEPLDDIRAGNPPTNPDLLNYLTREFIDHRFDTRHILRLICQSRTYQLSLATHAWNADDRINYSHAMPRRLPAEVLIDSVFQVTGSAPNFPGVPPGTRAAQLPDSGIDLPSGFLANLGRPARESACECERSNDLGLGSVLALLSGPAVSVCVNDPANAIARLVREQPDDRKVAEELFLRVLNRPASPGEMESALALQDELGRQHERLQADLNQAESSWAARKTQLDQERTLSIAQAEKALADHMVERAPHLARARRERLERIVAAEQAVQDHDPELPARLARWEAALTADRKVTDWVALDVKEVRGSGASKLEKLPDGSVRSTSNAGELPDYVVTTESRLANITGLKIEALPDDNLPGFGPGHNGGDFLLSELVVDWAAKTNAANLARAKIIDGKADSLPEGYNLKHAFDGVVEQGRREGWTIGKAVGEPHWAAFAFEKPIGASDITVLRVILQHRFEAPYELGRFRLWVTTSTAPLSEGLPADIAAIVRQPEPTRTSEQVSRLLAYYRSLDAAVRTSSQALAVARRPLPVDDRLVELEQNLSRVTRAIPTDPVLVQLRLDKELSTRQFANRRLTAAQDLTWALINTPAFLFNR